MNEQERQDLFADLTNRHQGELYAYIFSMVRNWADADDLYQTVCLVLWDKFEKFRLGSSFFAWARQTAKNTVRDYLKRKKSRRYISDEVLDALTDTKIELHSDDTELYMAALRRCKEKLSAADGELLELRFVEDLSSAEIADRLQRSQASVCRSLTRVQRSLMECVQREIARQEHSRGEGS
jgi:RNA polymerase sigma-70 factor (ECF subfamily)